MFPSVETDTTKPQILNLRNTYFPTPPRSTYISTTNAQPHKYFSMKVFHSEVCALARATGILFLETVAAVESFKCNFWILEAPQTKWPHL